jgi:hypothetical protein
MIEAFARCNITGENAYSNPENSRLNDTALENAATVIEKTGKSIQAIDSIALKQAGFLQH